MVVLDPREHISKAIYQNNIIKLFYFVKSYLLIYSLIPLFIISLLL